jgi:predicted RNase H-like nuclease (RuvC/YqgF family)
MADIEKVAEEIIDTRLVLEQLSQAEVVKFIEKMLDTVPWLCRELVYLSGKNRDLELQVSSLDMSLKECYKKTDAERVAANREIEGLNTKIRRMEARIQSLDTQLSPSH